MLLLFYSSLSQFGRPQPSIVEFSQLIASLASTYELCYEYSCVIYLNLDKRKKPKISKSNRIIYISIYKCNDPQNAKYLLIY